MEKYKKHMYILFKRLVVLSVKVAKMVYCAMSIYGKNNSKGLPLLAN